MSALYVLLAHQENRLFFLIHGFRTSLSNHKRFISDTHFDSEKGPSENLIRDHPYITSERTVSVGLENGIFVDVWYCT